MAVDSDGFEITINTPPTDIATILLRERIFGERQRHLTKVDYFPQLLSILETSIVPELQRKEEERTNT